MLLSLTRSVLKALSGRRLPDGPAGLRNDHCCRCGSRWPATCVTCGMCDCFGLTDIGRARECNEDQFLIANVTRSIAIRHSMSAASGDSDWQQSSDADLLLVADGVGGNAGGEQASRLAVEGVVEYMLNYKWAMSCGGRVQREQILDGLTAALNWAQQKIQRATATLPECSRMGTTLTLAYLAWPDVFIAHVGDSRVYVYHDSKLIQLTQDQTVAQMLADAGAIDAGNVKRHPFQNVLGSLLSADPAQLIPTVQRMRLSAGDQLLLCTDGLTKYLEPAQIAEILRFADTAKDACCQLVSSANEAGGSDNITVVVARFAGESRTLVAPYRPHQLQSPAPTTCVFA